MRCITVILVLSFACGVFSYTQRQTCQSMGYSCVPWYHCPMNRWIFAGGCGRWSVCCNLSGVNTCYAAGGTCRRECTSGINSKAGCPLGLKCCVQVLF
uniref:Carboxypeptidase inhibitor n=1 Tax=Rhipicephalus appendiculatus TaxID=34631 RepID=A0A131Z4Z9_RHIAP